MKYTSTILPSREGIPEQRKAVLDLLKKINSEAQYAFDHGLGLWLPDYELKRMYLANDWGLYLNGFNHRFESNEPAIGNLQTELILSLRDQFRALYYTDATGLSSQLICYRARGSRAAPGNVLSGDVIAGLLGGGYYGVDFDSRVSIINAGIQFIAEENFTSIARGTRIVFQTTTIGFSGRSERMRITNLGRVGINTTAPAARLESVAPVGEEAARFGDGTNMTVVERDGTVRFAGTATVWNDIFAALDPKSTGVGKPTLRAFSGNISQYTMAVNDLTEVAAAEFLHDWKEGSDIELHVHWASRGVDGTDRAVKWEIDYTWANPLGVTGTTAFPAAATASAETVIPANTPDKTHIRTSVITFTPAGGKINGNILLSLKRIASAGTAPTNDPWVLMVGIHYERDTVGSRTISAK